MKTHQHQFQAEGKNDDYLTIWQIEQEHARARWTMTTFYFSVSFAIFGYSFQNGLTHRSVLTVRLAALCIYWFGYLMFSRYNKQTRFLRTYLFEMEASHQTTLDIQTKAKANGVYMRRIGADHLLLGFGIFYMLAIVLIWILGL